MQNSLSNSLFRPFLDPEEPPPAAGTRSCWTPGSRAPRRWRKAGAPGARARGRPSRARPRRHGDRVVERSPGGDALTPGWWRSGHPRPGPCATPEMTDCSSNLHPRGAETEVRCTSVGRHRGRHATHRVISPKRTDFTRSHQSANTPSAQTDSDLCAQTPLRPRMSRGRLAFPNLPRRCAFFSTESICFFPDPRRL